MKHTGKGTLLAFLAILPLLAGCGPGFKRKTATLHQQWPAAGVQRIKVDALNGSIEVVSGDPSRIDLTADISLRARDPQRILQQGPVQTRLENGTLTISDRSFSRHRTVFIIPIVRTNEARVDYRLVIPAGMDLSLVNINGRIHVSGVVGSTEVRSVNGTIDVEKSGGELYAKTVNGRVSAEFDKDFRGARVKTVNGSINVSLPANSSFDFDVSQVNGSFRSNVPLEMSSAGRHSAGSVNGGQFPLELSTVNGSVTVERRNGSGA